MNEKNTYIKISTKHKKKLRRNIDELESILIRKKHETKVRSKHRQTRIYYIFLS